MSLAAGVVRFKDTMTTFGGRLSFDGFVSLAVGGLMRRNSLFPPLSRIGGRDCPPAPRSETSPEADRKRDCAESPTRRGRRGGAAGDGLVITRFKIEAPLLGYRASYTRHDRAYRQYKERVLLLALEAGYSNRGRADGDTRLSVAVYWEGRPRIDWKNVYGAVEDAIWYEDDSYVRPGPYSDQIPDSGVEYAEVTIERLDRPSGLLGAATRVG